MKLRETAIHLRPQQSQLVGRALVLGQLLGDDVLALAPDDGQPDLAVPAGRHDVG